MAFGAQILEDSLSPDGCRLTTMMFDFPRYIQAEVNTHGILSKNSGSSRAIPVKKMLQRLVNDPYMPVVWGSNKPGMQAGAELSEDEIDQCKTFWLGAMADCMDAADALRRVGLHKQDANRILEPWMWQTVVITGTEWWNFFNLRNHPEAHPAFQTVAAIMQDLYENTEPKKLGYGEWHLPFVEGEDWDIVGKLWPTIDLRPKMVKISVGRCARTSLLTHPKGEHDKGKRDIHADIELHDKLLRSGHLSPLQHQGRPAHHSDTRDAMVKVDHVRNIDGELLVEPQNQWSGNFRGFVQYRKTIPNEHDIMASL